jgi:hypothetical protein
MHFREKRAHTVKVKKLLYRSGECRVADANTATTDLANQML